MWRVGVDVSSAALVTDAPEDADEWSDSDLPRDDFPVEQFVSELEERMIAGQSRFSIRSWAFTDFGVKKETLAKFSRIVRASWAYADMGYSEARMRRQNVRDKLERLYDETMAAKQFSTALNVVNTLAELDGLKAPDVNLTQVNNTIVGAPGQPQITNRTRERISELVKTMTLRQDQRAMRQEDDEVRVLESKSQIPGRPKNGNGHG